MIRLTRKTLNRRIEQRRLYTRWVLTIMPLVAGAIVYLQGRKNAVLFETWLNRTKTSKSWPGSSWLPDYLWAFSLWMALVLVWKGWHHIPLSWKWAVVMLTMVSECLQWAGWINGTGDWIDALMYLLALATVYTLHKFKLI